MDVQVLLMALKTLRDRTPKGEFFLMLEYEIDGRPYAEYQVKIKHMVANKEVTSRMRMVIKEGDSYAVESIVKLFEETFTANFERIFT